eukprot:227663_1
MPFPGPYSSIAWTPYCEQVGRKRQAGGRRGDIQFLYNPIAATIPTVTGGFSMSALGVSLSASCLSHSCPSFSPFSAAKVDLIDLFTMLVPKCVESCLIAI